MNIRIFCLWIIVFSFAVNAKLADNFEKIANEKDIAVDSETGREIIYLTDGKYLNSGQYPHNKGWLEDEKYVIFESIRPRPDGKPSTGDNSDYRHVERQLMAADIGSGDIYWLASLEVEDTAKYGKNHLSMSSQYHSDYAPGSNVVVYYDMTGHNLYLLDLDDGQRKLLWNVKVGTLGDPPSITDDGSRLIVFVAHPGPENGNFFAGRTTAVYSIDLDPETNEIVKGPRVAVTWTNRAMESNPKDTNGINLSHSVINPLNKEEMFFCHGYSGLSDGSVDKARMWYAKTDGSLIKMDVVTPPGVIHTHEVWAGKYKYFVDIPTHDEVIIDGGITRYDSQSEKVEKIIEGVTPSPIHVAVSRDGKRIIWDTMYSLTKITRGESVEQNNSEDLVMLDVYSGKITKLARIMGGLRHPRHIHPNITPDGSKVMFTVADGVNSRVAVIKIDK